MKKKIIVTGGAGYIGSHTVVELQQAGYDVIIIDNFSNSSNEVINAIQKISGITPSVYEFDLADEQKVIDFFNATDNILGVIHFAAFKAVGESVENPLKYYQNNLFSLINLLKCMHAKGINNFVFSSSCTVYGQTEELPVKETTEVLKAFSPYGNTKKISEEIIIDTVNASNINSIALRYFNPIGAHPSALIGELPIGVPNNLVPFITQTAIGKRDCLSVFGDDYNTPDGTCIRDYIHVVDLAKAHVIAIDRLLKNKNKNKFEIFNLGTGKGYSVLDAIHSFEKVSGIKLKYKITKRREGDIESMFADTNFANKELGWVAESGLDEMMISAWNWEKNIHAHNQS